MKNRATITTNREISCGDQWCISVNGWYLKGPGGSNLTFLDESDALAYIEQIRKQGR